MANDIVRRIKLSVRISHSKLDEDIESDIEACLADMRLKGIVNPQPRDPIIFSAIKLYCRSSYTDDTAKSAEYLRRYEVLRDSLATSEGYGWFRDFEVADE